MTQSKRVFSPWLLPLAALLFFVSNTVASEPAIPTDKALHASFSLVISMAAYDFYRKNTSLTDNQARLAALASTLAIGAAKEISDEEFDWGDMAANGLGASVGIMIRF